MWPRVFITVSAILATIGIILALIGATYMGGQSPWRCSGAWCGIFWTGLALVVVGAVTVNVLHTWRIMAPGLAAADA